MSAVRGKASITGSTLCYQTSKTCTVSDQCTHVNHTHTQTPTTYIQVHGLHTHRHLPRTYKYMVSTHTDTYHVHTSTWSPHTQTPTTYIQVHWSPQTHRHLPRTYKYMVSKHRHLPRTYKYMVSKHTDTYQYIQVHGLQTQTPTTYIQVHGLQTHRHLPRTYKYMVSVHGGGCVGSVCVECTKVIYEVIIRLISLPYSTIYNQRRKRVKLVSDPDPGTVYTPGLDLAMRRLVPQSSPRGK